MTYLAFFLFGILFGFLFAWGIRVKHKYSTRIKMNGFHENIHKKLKADEKILNAGRKDHASDSFR